MLTDVCNLKCPYCFANEFVGRKANEITIENFKKALDFIATKPNQSVGLIGGEPTLHSKFRDILKMLINDERFEKIILFTNGIELDKYLKELTHPKFSILINLNSPQDIGQRSFDKICHNLDMSINEYYMKERITLGINIYNPNFEYKYILKVLKQYRFDHVRMSIVVPNTKEKRNSDIRDYFISIKPRLTNFIYDMITNDILPSFDCNKMPSCMLTDAEIRDLISMINKKQNKRKAEGLPPMNLIDSNSAIYTDKVGCYPVIDILSDLTAVRCFGLSEYTKVNIADFKNINDLANYYLNEIDSYAYKVSVLDDCDKCYKRKTLRCSGGCIAYKIDAINKLKERLRDDI